MNYDFNIVVSDEVPNIPCTIRMKCLSADGSMFLENAWVGDRMVDASTIVTLFDTLGKMLKGMTKEDTPLPAEPETGKTKRTKNGRTDS